jgi:hypothetical protein
MAYLFVYIEISTAFKDVIYYFLSRFKCQKATFISFIIIERRKRRCSDFEIGPECGFTKVSITNLRDKQQTESVLRLLLTGELDKQGLLFCL